MVLAEFFFKVNAHSIQFQVFNELSVFSQMLDDQKKSHIIKMELICNLSTS